MVCTFLCIAVSQKTETLDVIEAGDALFTYVVSFSFLHFEYDCVVAFVSNRDLSSSLFFLITSKVSLLISQNYYCLMSLSGSVSRLCFFAILCRTNALHISSSWFLSLV